MTEKYNPQAIEPKWQKKWDADQLYRAKVDWNKPKHYALTMLPYPSGDLHIGHWFAMTPSDARARFMRMQGYNVLFPMGFDAFGLPAENAAIQRGIHPAKWTYANIERMRGQLRSMGAMFDWKREAVSCDPIYYKWTEWFFKRFYDNGLAYRGEAMVNWSPTLQTVLANEQVIDGKDERTGQPVIQKMMTQWFFRYTRYADEMLNFDNIDWPEPVRIMQTNWIGRSEGAHVAFRTEQGDTIEVYTTRPDTLWGATFMVLAPEHKLVEQITTPEQREAVQAYKAQAARATEIERSSESREKTGIFTGAYAINPVNETRIPIWIADYVMVSYGSGAIMAVPYGDQRDFEFARKYDLPIVAVVKPNDTGIVYDPAQMAEAYAGPGVMINSGAINGTIHNGEKGRKSPAIAAAIDYLKERGIGREAVNYRLRDWLISRQRYWGSPIPMIYREDGTVEPVREDRLPVTLPDDVEMTGVGNPLAQHKAFVNTYDSDENPAKRETDTMDTFMCSSWYHLRYLSPQYDDAPFDPEEAAYWLPVDTYTGGAEHATMHLLYARWFNKAMRDTGMFDETIRIMKEHGRDVDGILDEPMLLLRNQGQILGEERRGDNVNIAGFRDRETGKGFALYIDNWRSESVNNDSEFLKYVIDKLFEKNEVTEVPVRSLFETHLDVWRGELIRRTENILTIRNSKGQLETVEVKDPLKPIIDQSRKEFSQFFDKPRSASTDENYLERFKELLSKIRPVPPQIDRIEGDGNINQLRHHLEIQRMSKSKGNVVNPDELVAEYGADTVRAYLMFAFDWSKGGPWDSENIKGVVRWLHDMWDIAHNPPMNVAGKPEVERTIERRVYQAIRRVTQSITDFSFNTAVAALMSLRNELRSAMREDGLSESAWREAMRITLLMMAPITPHIAEELWERLGFPYSIHQQDWPAYDEEKAAEALVTLVIQINGKVRDRVEVAAGITEEEAKAHALASEPVQRQMNGGEPRRVIFIGGKEPKVNVVL